MTRFASEHIGMEAKDILGVLRTWLIEHGLPLWSSEGWDQARGGFIERLDLGGRADHLAARRVRARAWRIYCFAKAAEIGWYPQGRALAMRGLDYLLAKAKSPD